MNRVANGFCAGRSAGTARCITPLPRDATGAANELQKAVREIHEGPGAGTGRRQGGTRGQAQAARLPACLPHSSQAGRGAEPRGGGA